MKREIKFRGIREGDNKWVYGYLFRTKKSLLSVEETSWIFNEDGKLKVYPETVGQSIGLNDKNNVEIYEDDKVEIVGTVESTVIFKNGAFGYVHSDTKFVILSQYYYFDWVDRISQKIEVVGNIHEIISEDKSCFFCGEICVQNVDCDKKSISAWIDKHGSFKRFAGRIGTKYICENCAGDLYGLVQND